MKTPPRLSRTAIWVILGLLVMLTSIALTRPIQFTSNDSDPKAGAFALQATPTLQVESDVGSTDGIVLLAAVIVLIVILPILVRWRHWAGNGKKSN